LWYCWNGDVDKHPHKRWATSGAAAVGAIVESGHVPMDTRPRLVDAVLDDGNVASCTHLLVAVPLDE
jgi:hypothetical protein